MCWARLWCRCPSPIWDFVSTRCMVGRPERDSRLDTPRWGAAPPASYGDCGGTGPISVPISRPGSASTARSEEHTSELQSQSNLVCRLLLEKKKKKRPKQPNSDALD